MKHIACWLGESLVCVWEGGGEGTGMHIARWLGKGFGTEVLGRHDPGGQLALDSLACAVVSVGGAGASL